MGTKKLGLFSGVAVCVGLIVATSCLISLGNGVGLAGSGFLLPLGIAMILNIFVAISFGELHSLMPKVEGGLGQYTLAAIGPVPSIISNVSAYVLCMILAGGAEALMCGIVVSEVFLPDVNPAIISAVVVGILFLTNMRGIDLFSKIQNVAVTLLIGSLAVMAVLSLFGLGSGQTVPAEVQTAPAISGFGDLASLSAIAFWLFIGVEFIIPVAKNLKNAKRDVLLSMVVALVVLFVVQGALGVGMTHYVALDELSVSTMPHMLFAENLMGDVGKYWMAFVTVLAVVSTLNTVLASSARIMGGMAGEKMLPKGLSLKNKKDVPYLSLLFMALAMLAVIISNPSDLIILILAGSCFWLVSYIFTHINVLVLRKKYPDAPRNKKLVLWGIPQILGISGCVYMILNIYPDPAVKAQIFTIFGIAFTVLVVFSVIWVRFGMKRSVFKAERIEDMAIADEAVEAAE